ncbi:MAG: exodeoxyribonuclease VII large subunit [Deltaproteobacteria bacterium]|nr:exodeoxyribonuclease VII large subunit [Deltaproteobacteria bacterium]
MDMFSDYKKILTVSELTLEIKHHLEEGFGEIWVEGEISNFRSPSSGHYYFTLKDGKSQIRAVIFRFMGRYLKFEPQDGLAVICRGKISVYEPRGEYQLILDYMEPKGIGALQLAFEQLKEKLEKEGLFDPARKKPLPLLPKRIGIVTSPTGAAIRDLLNVIGRRFPNVGILINPVKVQGKGSAQEIASAIYKLNTVPEIDVIIVTRGGGSLEDLWAFNEEIVARAIYNSSLPVISAVGHEIDFTIADFVADLRAPTPSAAGELVVKDKVELSRLVDSLSARLGNQIINLLETAKNQLVFFKKRLPDLRLKISDLQLRIDDMSGRLAPRILQSLELKKEMLESRRVRLLLRNPKLKVGEYLKSVSLCEKSLIDSVHRMLIRLRQVLERCVGELDSLSPLNVLQRGYSITRLLPSYKIVKDNKVISVGDKINIVLGKGEIFCQVDKIKD